MPSTPPEPPQSPKSDPSGPFTRKGVGALAVRRYGFPVHIRRLPGAAVYERGGLRSHVLLDAGDFGSERLVVTWVEVPEGGAQRPHVHPASEQVYVIVRGRGAMTVGDEHAEVGEGDMVLVPPETSHSIANAAGDTLIYVSATAPPQSMAGLYRTSLS